MAFPRETERRGPRLRGSSLLVLTGCLLLLACTPPPVPTQETASPPPQPSSTTAPSPTSAPSATFTATITLPSTLTLAPSLTATQTLTPTPAAGFDKFQLISVTNGIGGISLIFRLPGVKVPYQVKMRGYDYSCVLDAKYPDRLFCSGLADPPFDKPLDVLFIDPQTKQTVYTGTTVYSAGLYATALPQMNGKNDCPTRGQGVSCETECRLLPDNTPCIVSTCTDSCGLYRSIQTCPNDMSKDFASCPPDLFDQMKARYNIP
jgi:hypothetical protein